jgi:HEAT repeat protein
MTSNKKLTLAIVFTSVFTAGPAFAQTPAAPPAPPATPSPQTAPVPPAPVILPGLAVPVIPSDVGASFDRLEVDHLRLAAIDAEVQAARMADAVHSIRGEALMAGLHAMDLAGGFQDRAQSAEEREKARAAMAKRSETDRENRLYDEGYRHVSESRWDRAIERFNEVVSGKGSRVDAALYWKAYAQDRAGQRAEALNTLSTLFRDHPNSRYTQQAKALEAEVRRNAGQPVNPQEQADEDLKLMALAALQHQAPEQAIPMLAKLLSGTASPKLKERALFVLAQSNSAQAREVLKGIAKGNSTPELQSRAISYLGNHGGPESRAILADVYSSTSDVDMKKRILRAFMTGGEKDRLLTAAQTEQNPELRATAVQQLGVMGAHTELSQLYARESSVEIKKQIIQAMYTGGNATRMMELARTEQNPELRRVAVRNLGLMGGKGNADVLVEIYNTDKDPAVKRTAISALGMNDRNENAAALVAIARKEQDPALKKEIVTRLTHMQGSKVAMDYIMEILSK